MWGGNSVKVMHHTFPVEGSLPLYIASSSGPFSSSPQKNLKGLGTRLCRGGISRLIIYEVEGVWIRFLGKERLQIGRDMFFKSGVRCDKNTLFVTLQVGRATWFKAYTEANLTDLLPLQLTQAPRSRFGDFCVHNDDNDNDKNDFF